jgi:hypothetical protein
MRTLAKSAILLAAGLLLVPATLVTAQAPQPEQDGVQSGSEGRGGGQGWRQRGAGRMGQPVQGTVSAVSSGKVTIKTDAGDTYVITPGDNARVMKDRQPIQVSDIKPGDTVIAMGQVDATKKSVTAMMLMDLDPAAAAQMKGRAAKAKENLGKTYITGRITSIDADNLKLTVQRQDGVSQTVQVDEGTSFQRGMRGVTADIEAAGGGMAGGGMRMGGGFGGRGAGRQGGGGQSGTPAAPESITLADIKVGDTVAATGSVKNGSFMVQKMGVAAPRGAGGRMGAGSADGAGAPAATPPSAQ